MCSCSEIIDVRPQALLQDVVPLANNARKAHKRPRLKPFNTVSVAQKRKRLNSVKGVIFDAVVEQGEGTDKASILKCLAQEQEGVAVLPTESVGVVKDELEGVAMSVIQALTDKNDEQMIMLLSILRSIPKITLQECNARFFQGKITID